MKIAASLMCANLLEMGRDIAELEAAGIDYWHADIMDGVYVPNLAMSFDTIHAIKKVTNVPIDAHFMVQNPENFVEDAAKAGVDVFSFHIETCPFAIRLIDQIKQAGMKAGVAFNPATSLAQLPYFVDRLDFIVMMTVEPGFAGQKFIDSVVPKISAAQDMVKSSGRAIDIQVDGNINVPNARKVLAAGGNILVGGTSSIFRKEGSLGDNLKLFKEAVLA